MRKRELTETSIRSHTRRIFSIPLAALITLAFVVSCATSDPTSVDRAQKAVEAARQTGLVGSDSLDFNEAEPGEVGERSQIGDSRLARVVSDLVGFYLE